MRAFRTAVEQRDLVAAVDLLADDVEFHSPVAFKPFKGKEAVTEVLRAVMDTFEDFVYTDELERDGFSTLFFDARVGEKKLQGVDILRLDDDGKIVHFTVMLRPLSGVIAMAEAMGPKVAHLAKV
ncbi:MAG: nuclear transport factor 2 family protein [Solirubrobacterales bacterium]